MNITKVVKREIGKMEDGNIFDYSYFPKYKDEIFAIVKSLSRLEKSGSIVRISKGKYLKPKVTIFGGISPDELNVIKAFTKEKNKRIGYLTGSIIYNRFGISTQISNTIEIATVKQRRSRQIGNINIKFVKKNVSITEDNVPFLQVLDVLSNVKKVTDSNPDDVLKVIKMKLKQYLDQELKKIVQLSNDYPPFTRALLGAILEELDFKMLATKLKKGLNPLSSYKLEVSEKMLRNKIEWNIK